MLIHSERIVEEINRACAAERTVTPIKHAFLLGRRPVLRPLTVLLLAGLIALPASIIVTRLGVDTPWIAPALTGLLTVPATLVATHTRHAFGVAGDGSGVIVRFSVFRWSRQPCKSIVDTFASRTPLALEESSRWWRKPRITIDGRTWYLGYEEADQRWFNPDEEPVDFRALERWLTNRGTLAKST